MWDNAILLRNVANTLIGLSLLAAFYTAAHYLVHLPGLFPVRSVRLVEAPQRVSAVKVLQVMRKEVRGNLFTVDIKELRQSLEKLPWARSVSIRREFPQGLAVEVEEHQALARWNNGALVNRQGEVFVAESQQALPKFVGQDGMSAEMAQHYARFNDKLAALGLSVAQVVLSPRHAWQLRLSNGMVLELGREDMQQRLARFVAVYPYTEYMAGNSVKYVDLRYRNGFAVRQVPKDKERGGNRWNVG